MNPRTHKGDFIITHRYSVSKLVQGDLLTFLYSTSTKNPVKDKRPFILFLGWDKKQKLIHGLALNYLTKRQISMLFKKLNSSLFEGARLIEEDQIDKIEATTLSRVSVGSHANQGMQEAQGVRIYERIAKPFFRSTGKDIYRTYKIPKVRSLQLVRYRWDMTGVNRLQ